MVKKILMALLVPIMTVSFGSVPMMEAKSKTKSLPKIITKSKFGFLSAGSNDTKYIKQYGARWVRPHPGPFLWDSVQNTAGASYNFSGTDAIVKKYSNKKIGIVATLWPFAEWDQQNRSDYNTCAVSENDEFLQSMRDKEGKTEVVAILPAIAVIRIVGMITSRGLRLLSSVTMEMG